MADQEAEGTGDEGTGDKKVEAEGTILGKETPADGDKGEGEGDDKGEADVKADADDKADKKEADEKGKDQQDEGEKPGEFDISKFDIPEGTEISEKWMKTVTEHPAVQKLVQSDLNELIGMVGEFVNDRENTRVETQNSRTAEWAEAFAKDPWVIENGGVEKVTPLSIATRDAYFPGLNQLFDETGLGSNSIMLVGLAKIAGDLHILEAQLEGGGMPPGTGAKGSAAHRIFKDYVPGGKHDPNPAS